MQVILLERVENLGVIGDVVNVKLGYARNFLLPKKKALRATEANIEYFNNKRKDIEANNEQKRKLAERIASKMDGTTIVLARQASDSGFLFGSIRPADVVEALAEQGHEVSKRQVRISSPIRAIGTYKVGIMLHPEVIANINLRVKTIQEQTINTKASLDNNQ